MGPWTHGVWSVRPGEVFICHEFGVSGFSATVVVLGGVFFGVFGRGSVAWGRDELVSFGHYSRKSKENAPGYHDMQSLPSILLDSLYETG